MASILSFYRLILLLLLATFGAASVLHRWPKRLAEIRKAIERHIGVAPKDVTYKYIALNYNDLADLALVNISNRGMALFQYDPDSDGNGQRAWRLFYEVSFKHKMLF
ncbi:uncharacterized protein MCYG_02123 [Microsporum canis CBS 113480]|uniref:Uncharacterized protein n=1 Tax=Arthroderma otae (strain ATCC MYA-4605 / CBS 113480) TaxID=554155 RepID=C5FIN5_ARTOC|nr:uncharacterized protein MCYG_02123 [Microsporum canis CBS 113480]EEQ29304.1 predicted protein [Microsporum canis CBS 113480]